MLRSAFSSLAILFCVGGLSAGCEEKTAPTPEKATATTNEPVAATGAAEQPEAPTTAAPAETAAPSASVADEIPTAPADAPKPAAKPAPADTQAAKPAAAPAAETKGAAATSATFGAWLQGGKYEVGKPGALTAVLTAQGEYHCNDKYPYKFTLDPAPPGVSFPSTVVKGMNITEKRSTMSIPFSASEKGAKTISGTLAFSVCNADRCLIEKQKLSITINVM